MTLCFLHGFFFDQNSTQTRRLENVSEPKTLEEERQDLEELRVSCPGEEWREKRLTQKDSDR